MTQTSQDKVSKYQFILLSSLLIINIFDIIISLAIIPTEIFPVAGSIKEFLLISFPVLSFYFKLLGVNLLLLWIIQKVHTNQPIPEKLLTFITFLYTIFVTVKNF